MKLRLALILAIIALFAIGLTVWGQVDSLIGQFTNSPAESFAGSVSGDGRFVVAEPADVDVFPIGLGGAAAGVPLRVRLP